MNDKQNATIAVLCITATLLAAALLLLRPAAPAIAAASESRAGDYSMVTTSLSSSTDALIVVDATARKLNVYGLNRDGRIDLDPSLTLDLAREFALAGQAIPGAGGAPPVTR
jgi:hypothetical protein